MYDAQCEQSDPVRSEASNFAMRGVKLDGMATGIPFLAHADDGIILEDSPHTLQITVDVLCMVAHSSYHGIEHDHQTKGNTRRRRRAHISWMGSQKRQSRHRHRACSFKGGFWEIDGNDLIFLCA